MDFLTNLSFVFVTIQIVILSVMFMGCYQQGLEDGRKVEYQRPKWHFIPLVIVALFFVFCVWGNGAQRGERGIIQEYGIVVPE